MQLQFDEKNGSTLLTVDQLRQTMAVGQFDGKMPASVPLVHFELIDTLQAKASKVGITLDVPPLVIRERYCRKQKDAPDNLPSRFIVNRMAGKIYFDDYQFEGTDDRMRPGIAFTYVYDTALRGIQVAFGPNVAACDNLTVWGQYTFSTNGNSKVPWEKGLQLIDSWMQNYKPIVNGYTEKIKALKAVEVNDQVLNTMIGDLFTKAVRVNNNIKDGDRSIDAPLNQSEISAMVSFGFARKAKNADKPVTAWDIMNWGTQVLKPHNSDMTDLIANTAAFNDYVYNAFCVPIEDSIGEAVVTTQSTAPKLQLVHSPSPELF